MQHEKAEKRKGRKACELNSFIEESRIKLHRPYTQLEESGQPITERILQEMFFGMDKKREEVRTIPFVKTRCAFACSLQLKDEQLSETYEESRSG